MASRDQLNVAGVAASFGPHKASHLPLSVVTKRRACLFLAVVTATRSRACLSFSTGTRHPHCCLKLFAPPQCPRRRAIPTSLRCYTHQIPTLPSVDCISFSPCIRPTDPSTPQLNGPKKPTSSSLASRGTMLPTTMPSEFFPPH